MTLPISLYVLIAAVLHLAAFVSYPHSGRFGFTFLYISLILWTAGAIFINRAANYHGRAWKAAVAAGFALMCAFSALAFLPQKDGISPLRKLAAGHYPTAETCTSGCCGWAWTRPACCRRKKRSRSHDADT